VDEQGRWLWLQGEAERSSVRANAFFFDSEELLHYSTYGVQLQRDFRFLKNALLVRPAVLGARWKADSLATAYGVVGATAQYLRPAGPVFVQIAGDAFHAGDNGLARGQYAALRADAFGTVAQITVGAGVVQAFNPLRAETGYSVWASRPFGEGIRVDAQFARTVSDPIYGSPRSYGFTLVASWRFSRRAPPPPPVLAEVGAPAQNGRLVKFTVSMDTASSVAVSGTFSDWHPLPLKRDGNVWSGTFPIEPGTHQFGFLVNDSTWYVPPNAADVIDDGFGRKNVTLVVRPQ
jgi:hypothetical protein